MYSRAGLDLLGQFPVEGLNVRIHLPPAERVRVSRRNFLLQPQGLITALEGGAASMVFASGMAAAAVFHSLDPGAHIVAPRVMYCALRRWLGEFAAKGAVAVDFIDTISLDRLRAAAAPGRPGWCGSRRRPTHCGRSPTSPARPR